MAEVKEGSVVDGRYRVLRKLGAGGMADVWLAEDQHLQRQVALKVLHRHFAQDREFVARFQREAEAAAALQHPNIVSVYDRGEVDGTSYIAMQYVEGPTLKQLIDRGLSPEQAVMMIRQVLEAARAAHRQGIVHRDLKPQNVIVDDEGKAHVADFGIARAGLSEITQTGSVMGTPQYLSPEQAQGYEVSSVSDLYSIGVLLYEALTGRVPFEGESAVAVAMKQVSQTPQRPSTLNPQVSPALDAVVMRALEKEPGQRFQSADAFIAALDQAMREPGSASGTQSFAPLPPVVATPVEGEDEEEDKGRKWLWIGLAIAAIVGVLIGLALTRDTSTGVPNVTGNQLNVAIALLDQEGFQVGQIKRVERQTAPNTVLEQDPVASPPADPADENCSFLTFFCSKPKVDLTISNGPGSSPVPGTSGLEVEAATKKLEDAGFKVAVEERTSASVEVGIVLHSEPSGGETATNGSRVTLFVSSGPKKAGIPALVGTQRNSAVERIRARGFEPVVQEEESTSPAGQVISQTPPAGGKLPIGSEIIIVVARPMKKAKVPSVVGVERREAVEAIREAGLVPVVEEEETENEEEIGLVISQSPEGREEVEPKSEVTLVVGKRSQFPLEEEP
ncbi:MAG TPA: PASTA domain-containing protein [Solirubrobacterales bacterium]|nr:PASTA domain-containing protein [Solirubrobacterales bacterium]